MIINSEDVCGTTANPDPKPSSFAVNVLKMAGGLTSAQALSSLAAPITLRIYSPKAFGMSAVFTAVESLLIAFVCFRYERTILLPEDDEQAANSVGLCLVLVCLVALCTIPIAWWAVPLVLLKTPELMPYRWLFPPAVLLSGILLTLTRWNIRRQRFGFLSTLQIAEAGCTVLAQISLGLSSHGNGGMFILANLIGIMIATTVLVVVTWRHSSSILRRITVRQMLFMMKRYARFPKYGFASSIFDTLGWQTPALVLSGFFSTSLVGQYSLASRVMRIPMSLAGTSICSVFSQRAAEANHKGDLPRQVEVAFRYLVLLFLFPSLVLVFVAKDLLVVLFGQQWAEAGTYTQILSVWLCFWLISAPLNTIFSVLEQQHLEMRLNLLILVSRLVSLFLGGWLRDARFALLLFSGSGALIYGYYCMIALHRAQVSRWKMMWVLLRNFLAFVPAGLILGSLKWFSAPPLYVLGTGAVLLLAYYLNFVRTDPIVRGWLRLSWQKLPTENFASRAA